jgi:hypothetical protein
MSRTWTAVLAVLAFGVAFLAASVALGGEEPDARGPAHLRWSSVAALPTIAKDPAVELAQARAARRERLRARRERLRARRRAAARRAAATELPVEAPAPTETPTSPAPEPVAPPAAAPAPAPTPPPAPPPETFDDSG